MKNPWRPKNALMQIQSRWSKMAKTTVKEGSSSSIEGTDTVSTFVSDVGKRSAQSIVDFSTSPYMPLVAGLAILLMAAATSYMVYRARRSGGKTQRDSVKECASDDTAAAKTDPTIPPVAIQRQMEEEEEEPEAEEEEEAGQDCWELPSPIVEKAFSFGLSALVTGSPSTSTIKTSDETAGSLEETERTDEHEGESENDESVDRSDRREEAALADAAAMPMKSRDSARDTFLGELLSLHRTFNPKPSAKEEGEEEEQLSQENDDAVVDDDNKDDKDATEEDEELSQENDADDTVVDEDNKEDESVTPKKRDSLLGGLFSLHRAFDSNTSPKKAEEEPTRQDDEDGKEDEMSQESSTGWVANIIESVEEDEEQKDNDHQQQQQQRRSSQNIFPMVWLGMSPQHGKEVEQQPGEDDGPIDRNAGPDLSVEEGDTKERSPEDTTGEEQGQQHEQKSQPPPLNPMVWLGVTPRKKTDQHGNVHQQENEQSDVDSSNETKPETEDGNESQQENPPPPPLNPMVWLGISPQQKNHKKQKDQVPEDGTTSNDDHNVSSKSEQQEQAPLTPGQPLNPMVWLGLSPQPQRKKLAGAAHYGEDTANSSGCNDNEGEDGPNGRQDDNDDDHGSATGKSEEKEQQGEQSPAAQPLNPMAWLGMSTQKSKQSHRQVEEEEASGENDGGDVNDDGSAITKASSNGGGGDQNGQFPAMNWMELFPQEQQEKEEREGETSSGEQDVVDRLTADDDDKQSKEQQDWLSGGVPVLNKVF